MPKCPYCNEELRVRLSALFVSEIDENYEKALASFIDRGPGFFKSFLKSQIEMAKKYPMLLNVLSCAKCDATLDLEPQRMGRSS